MEGDKMTERESEQVATAQEKIITIFRPILDSTYRLWINTPSNAEGKYTELYCLLSIARDAACAAVDKAIRR
jgi:hypothetical protein